MPAPSATVLRRRDGVTTNIATREVVSPRMPAMIPAPTPCPQRLLAQRLQAKAQLEAIRHPVSSNRGFVGGGSAPSKKAKRQIGR